jgi:hypothetical protein
MKDNRVSPRNRSRVLPFVVLAGGRTGRPCTCPRSSKPRGLAPDVIQMAQRLQALSVHRPITAAMIEGLLTRACDSAGIS